MDNYFGINKINELIKEICSKKDKIIALEAGCGHSSKTFDYGANSHIVGIDISLYELHKNERVHSRILGDIKNDVFRPLSFNVIVCIEVLEHINKPHLVLQNFVKYLKDDGIIVIVVPNLLSVKGIITKFTPYRFHCWVYKYFFKFNKLPNPTYFRMAIAPIALYKFADKNKLIVQWRHLGGGWLRKLKEKSLIIFALYTAFGIIMKILTFGVVSISKESFTIVYRKA